MCKQDDYQLLQNGECLGWHVCHSTFFIFTFALKVVGLCRHRRRHRRRHTHLLRHRTNNIWHTRSARSARSVITLAEVVETPVVVSTATLVTGVAVGLVYSCVDDPSTLSIAITASVLIAASLSQGSKGKEKETQAEKLRSLHVWFAQMCLYCQYFQSGEMNQQATYLYPRSSLFRKTWCHHDLGQPPLGIVKHRPLGCTIGKPGGGPWCELCTIGIVLCYT